MPDDRVHHHIIYVEGQRVALRHASLSFEREGRHQSAVLYANNGMVVSSDPTWLQGAFNTLVAIFDRVGLLTNFRKTVSMVCHPCQAGDGNRTEEAYGRRLTG